MPKTYAEVEARIQEALGAISRRDKWTYAAVAREFNIPAERLRNRHNGVPSRMELIPPNRKLSEAQEAAVCEYLNRLDQIGTAVRLSMLRNCADLILYRSHDNPNTPPSKVSNNWSKRFLERHPQYYIRKQKLLICHGRCRTMSAIFQPGLKNLRRSIVSKGFNLEIAGTWMRLVLGLELGRTSGLLQEILQDNYISQAQTIVNW